MYTRYLFTRLVYVGAASLYCSSPGFARGFIRNLLFGERALRRASDRPVSRSPRIRGPRTRRHAAFFTTRASTAHQFCMTRLDPVSRCLSLSGWHTTPTHTADILCHMCHTPLEGRSGRSAWCVVMPHSCLSVLNPLHGLPRDRSVPKRFCEECLPVSCHGFEIPKTCA